LLRDYSEFLVTRTGRPIDSYRRIAIWMRATSAWLRTADPALPGVAERIARVEELHASILHPINTFPEITSASPPAPPPPGPTIPGHGGRAGSGGAAAGHF
ncbi:MAG: hypothetical protein ACTHN0_20040, partial [Aquihabitans sp.]